MQGPKLRVVIPDNIGGKACEKSGYDPERCCECGEPLDDEPKADVHLLPEEGAATEEPVYVIHLFCMTDGFDR